MKFLWLLVVTGPCSGDPQSINQIINSIFSWHYLMAAAAAKFTTERKIE